MSPVCSAAPESRIGNAPGDSYALSKAAYPAGEHDNSLIDALPGAVLLLDQRGVIFNANATAREWLAGTLVGEAWRDVYTRELSQLPSGRELTTRENRLLNIATRPLGDKPGQVILLSDVTESRALQELVDRSSRLAAMGEMTARLSHQIRTPVATAVLYLTHLENGSLDTKTRQKFAKKSLARLQHVEKMIRDMLMFAHGGRMESSAVSVGSLVEEFQQQLEPLVESAGARCVVCCSSNATVRANPVGLVTAMLNICNNAIENVRDKLLLQVVVSDSEDGVQFDISDNGGGIPESLRQRVFQPFYTTRSDGTGLGLPVVQSVVAAHDGTIEISDAVGGGARFSITLPAVPKSADEDCVHAAA